MPYRHIAENHERRLWDNIEILDSGCWKWKPRNVGRPRYLGQLVYHTLYERLVGPLPDDVHRQGGPGRMDLDHAVCQNGDFCINPFHLELVPHRVNCKRGRRTHLTIEHQSKAGKAAAAARAKIRSAA